MSDMEQAMLAYFEPSPVKYVGFDVDDLSLDKKLLYVKATREALEKARREALQSERMRKATKLKFFNGPYSFRRVIYVCAATCEVDEADILSKSRVAEHVVARHLVMWFLHKKRGFAKNRIGLLLDRDHTTVLHGIVSVEAKYEEYEPYINRALEIFAQYKGDWK